MAQVGAEHRIHPLGAVNRDALRRFLRPRALSKWEVDELMKSFVTENPQPAARIDGMRGIAIAMESYRREPSTLEPPRTQAVSTLGRFRP